MINKIFKKLYNIIKILLKYKTVRYPLFFLLIFIITITFIIKLSGDKDYNFVLENKTINDVTQLNPLQVNKIVKAKNTHNIVKEIKNSNGNISIGGGKFSMGGQTGYENSLHFDMRSFNKIIKLDTLNKTVTVQSGITWRSLQDYIDKFNLSIKIMQTYANFTVGGSISVNCHGRYIGHGPIISSVLEIEIVTANGDIIKATPNKNSEVFNAVIGGYGGIGIITEVKLQLVENLKVKRKSNIITINNYLTYFNDQIKSNKRVIFQNGDIYPPDYDQINSVSWEISNDELTNEERITPIDKSYFFEPRIVELISWGNFGKWTRQKIIDPIIYSFDAVVWRNKEASYDVKELEPSSREDYTYVLQEYFIPVENIVSFTKKMKNIFNKYDVNIINVSLRHALPDTNSYLSWAPKEVFAFVVYYKQGTDVKSKSLVKKWTIEMTNAILSENGTWYLPYQPHATIEQFKLAFKNSDKYFEVKNKLDPNFRFKNKLLDKYNYKFENRLKDYKNTINSYSRPEEQTFLTVPEWYLVFNPKEYSEFIESNNPSDFPFYSSIQEYWCLYDKSLKLVSKAYKENKEYKLMLDVIGISITVEYLIKMIYENTFGKFFSLFESGYLSEEEKIINQANKAYSSFIYHTAWYEFDFIYWVQKIWEVEDKTNDDFIRKYERMLFFTLEFSIKSIYANLIEIGAESSYDESNDNIYLTLNSKNKLKENKNLKILFSNGYDYIISIKKWGPFTEEIMKLDFNNITFSDISGNDEIVLSVLANSKIKSKLKTLKYLYKSNIVTNNKLERYLYKIEVFELNLILKYCRINKIEVEHIFDY